MFIYDVADRHLFETFRDVMVPKFLTPKHEYYALFIVANNDGIVER